MPFDSSLKFDKQIHLVVNSSSCYLMLLAKAKLWLSRNDFEKVIQAFISTRLDYCNSLYVGINKQSTSRLQMVQHSVARLLLGVQKREHITPILMSFHWLPVHFIIYCKILFNVF